MIYDVLATPTPKDLICVPYVIIEQTLLFDFRNIPFVGSL